MSTDEANNVVNNYFDQEEETRYTLWMLDHPVFTD